MTTPNTRRVIAPGRRARAADGRYATAYTLSYATPSGVVVRPGLSARAVETIGRVVASRAGGGIVWDIEVRNSRGDDVTFGFPCFR